MILTSITLVLLIVGLLGAINVFYSRRTFDEEAARLKELQDTALRSRGEAQMLTMVESARTALMQSDYSNLQTFVPQAAKTDQDVAAIYVITDNGMVAAHSDPRLKEKPVAEVDPVLGPRMEKITAKVSEEMDPETNPRIKEPVHVFASPVMAQGRKLGTLVIVYSLASFRDTQKKVDQNKEAQSRAYLVQTAVLALLFVLIGTGIAVFQGLRITRPIKLLARRADQIARGDLDTRVEVDSADEIGMLAENFNHMADQLQVLLADTKAKAVMEKELELARAIQETLVPSSDLIERGQIKVAGYFQPATQCGGDWWAVHDLPDNRVLIIIGDVTGHGVPAAMITAAAKAACDVGRALEGPRLTAGRLLEVMNRAIFESARRKFVMTCFACVIDTRTKVITYANAGHNFPYLYRAPGGLKESEAEFTVLMSRGNRLGDVPESTFAESSQTLRSGDTLVFFTDGLVECENAAHEEFGEKRMRTAIRNAAGLGPAQMRDAMVAAAASFYGDHPRKDDITLIIAHID